MMIVISDTWLCSYVIHGHGGLDSLIRAAFQRPVQIVRQFISHIGQTRYPAYAHIITTKVCQEPQHKGLSNYIVKHLCEGIKKDNNYHWYNKPYN
jgi:hypothetical protein